MNKIKGRHGQKHGAPRVFTENEEKIFASHLITLSNFGFPVDTHDLRIAVKSYLERQGRNVSCFNDNVPGPDWVNMMLSRRPALTQRLSQNISHTRAATDEQTITDLFSYLEAEPERVESQNIWNYDETNLVDDPGRTKIITRKETKYPEKITNTSKACTSLMIFGTAKGEVAPVYVNYKAQKLWSTCTENGPPNARYNRTNSG